MDFMGLAVENEILKQYLSKCPLQQLHMQRSLQQKEEECVELKRTGLH